MGDVPPTVFTDVEKGFLITYNVINTLLIISFNALVLGIIAFSKVSNHELHQSIVDFVN